MFYPIYFILAKITLAMPETMPLLLRACCQQHLRCALHTQPCQFDAATTCVALNSMQHVMVDNKGNGMCLCSVETQDSSGRWVPCVLTCLPYDELCVIERADRELAVLKAMSGSRHVPTLLSDGITLKDSTPYVYMVTRLVPQS